MLSKFSMKIKKKNRFKFLEMYVSIFTKDSIQREAYKDHLKRLKKNRSKKMDLNERNKGRQISNIVYPNGKIGEKEGKKGGKRGKKGKKTEFFGKNEINLIKN